MTIHEPSFTWLDPVRLPSPGLPEGGGGPGQLKHNWQTEQKLLEENQERLPNDMLESVRWTSSSNDSPELNQSKKILLASKTWKENLGRIPTFLHSNANSLRLPGLVNVHIQRRRSDENTIADFYLEATRTRRFLLTQDDVCGHQLHCMEAWVCVGVECILQLCRYCSCLAT